MTDRMTALVLKEQKLARHLIARMNRLLDVDRVVETGRREAFRMGQFDLTCDQEVAPGGVDGRGIELAIWERCDVIFLVIVDSSTQEITNLLTLDYDRCTDEVMPILERILVLDELADI